MTPPDHMHKKFETALHNREHPHMHAETHVPGSRRERRPWTTFDKVVLAWLAFDRSGHAVNMTEEAYGWR
ncbi:hypothetical protein BLJAPNOD_05158 [Ensifer sp. M14]|nr:hypothetical protein BLJAPNOD_05158 [Ensifer sp. M14]